MEEWDWRGRKAPCKKHIKTGRPDATVRLHDRGETPSVGKGVTLNQEDLEAAASGKVDRDKGL